MNPQMSIYDEAVARHKDQDRRQMEADTAEVLKSPAGRRLFMSIIFAGGVYSHSRNTDNVVYMTGRRDAALEVMNVANSSAAEYVLLARQERHQLILERNRELAKARNYKKEQS